MYIKKVHAAITPV